MTDLVVQEKYHTGGLINSVGLPSLKGGEISAEILTVAGVGWV
jgi:hypothetical protein